MEMFQQNHRSGLNQLNIKHLGDSYSTGVGTVRSHAGATERILHRYGFQYLNLLEKKRRRMTTRGVSI